MTSENSIRLVSKPSFEGISIELAMRVAKSDCGCDNKHLDKRDLATVSIAFIIAYWRELAYVGSI